MSDRETLIAKLEELVGGDISKMILLDDHEDAAMGISSLFGCEDRVCYDKNLILKKLMDRDGMTIDQADEFFDFNIAGLHAGEHTPCFVTNFNGEGNETI